MGSSKSVPGNPFHNVDGNFPSKTGNPSGGNRGNNPSSSVLGNPFHDVGGNFPSKRK